MQNDCIGFVSKSVCCVRFEQSSIYFAFGFIRNTESFSNAVHQNGKRFADGQNPISTTLYLLYYHHVQAHNLCGSHEIVKAKKANILRFCKKSEKKISTIGEIGQSFNAAQLFVVTADKAHSN